MTWAKYRPTVWHEALRACALMSVLIAVSSSEKTVTYNTLSPTVPTQPFQPTIEEVGCASAKFHASREHTFFLLYGACFAGLEHSATWLYSVGPNTWIHSDPTFGLTLGRLQRGCGMRPHHCLLMKELQYLQERRATLRGQRHCR